MGALQAEPVEDVDNAARAIIESKWRRELLASTESRRVDDDHLMLGAEVLGLRRHMSPVISRLGQNTIASPLPRTSTRTDPSTLSINRDSATVQCRLLEIEPAEHVP